MPPPSQASAASWVGPRSRTCSLTGGGAGLATGHHAGASPGAPGQVGSAPARQGVRHVGRPGCEGGGGLGGGGRPASLASGSVQRVLAGRGRRASRLGSAAASDPRPAREPGRGCGQVSGSAWVWSQCPQLPPLARLGQVLPWEVGTPGREPRATWTSTGGPAPCPAPSECPRRSPIDQGSALRGASVWGAQAALWGTTCQGHTYPP